jgi:hypothetical protein
MARPFAHHQVRLLAVTYLLASRQFMRRRTPNALNSGFGRADQGPYADRRNDRHNKAPRGQSHPAICHGNTVAIASSASVTPGPLDAK